MAIRTSEELAVLQRARKFARVTFANLRQDGGTFEHSHESFAAEKALEMTVKQFQELFAGCTVEGDCAGNGEGHITVQYINMGDTYDLTICFHKGRFVVGSWGDIAERSL
jgi:hypothetical protein